MEAILGIVLFIAAIWFISWLREKSAEGGIRRTLAKGFNVQVKRETVTLDSGDGVDVYKVSIAGSFAVPTANTQYDLVVRITDVTHDIDKDDWPVLCLIPDLADSDGVFENHQGMTVPHEFSTLNRVSILAVPLPALVFARKGQRRARIGVFLASADSSRVYCHGKTFIQHQQDSFGYTEAKKRNIEADKAVVAVALSMCAADGQVTRSEAAVVRGYCTSSLMGLDENQAAEKRKALNKTMSLFLEKHRSNGQVVWNRACDRITEHHGPEIAQTAYDLCVRIVGADGVADQRELSLLDATAQRLGIPSELDRELRDRYFRMAMFDEQRDDDLLGMPDGLSREEKIDFLNREYQKWRRRVTHQDGEIAAEAALRVKRIGEARKRLEKE